MSTETTEAALRNHFNCLRGCSTAPLTLAGREVITGRGDIACYDESARAATAPAWSAATVVKVTTPGGTILHRSYECERAPAEASPFTEVAPMPAKLTAFRCCHACMITVTGRPYRWAHAKRYTLSNGWFVDGATVRHGYAGDDKYSLYEPGGDPSGCAARRGSAPTLALMLAVANGGQPCTRHGCRNLATGSTAVALSGGRQGFTFHCDDHEKKSTTN